MDLSNRELDNEVRVEETEEVEEAFPIKKKRKWKLKAVMLIIIALAILYFGYMAYGYREEVANRENNAILKKLEDKVETGELKKVQAPDPSIKNPLTDVNPRRSFLNASDDEVAYIDHEGNIQGIGNLTFTTSAEGYGFFQYLGDATTKITTGWFTNLYADFFNSTNVSSTYYGNSSDWYTVEQFLNDTDTDTTIGNCSGKGSCSDVVYSNYDNTAPINVSNNITVIGVCWGDGTTCDSVIYWNGSNLMGKM